MDIIGANRHNNNKNDLYKKAVNSATEIKNLLQLPPHCNLVLHNKNLIQFETRVLIEFTNPHSNYRGSVLIEDVEHMMQNDAVPDNGYVCMLCFIEPINGYFMEITVNNLTEMLEVVVFYQNLLEYQPEEQFIEHELEQNNASVYIPEHLLNY